VSSFEKTIPLFRMAMIAEQVDCSAQQVIKALVGFSSMETA